MAVNWKLSGDYYVDAVNGSDSNAGTAVAPFKTIQAAASAISAGETIIVGPGIYNEQIDGDSNRYSQLYADGFVVVDGTGVSNTGVFYDCYEWDIQNFKVINCIEVIGAADYRRSPNFTSCEFRDCTKYTDYSFYNTVNFINTCIFANFAQGCGNNSSTIYFINFRYTNCIFIDAVWGNTGFNNHTSYQAGNTLENCMFLTTPDNRDANGYFRAMHQPDDATDVSSKNLFFQDGALVACRGVNLGVATIAQGAAPSAYPGYTNTPEAYAAVNPVNFIGNAFTQASASFNFSVLSGSSAFSTIMYTFQAGNNSDVFNASVQPAGGMIGKNFGSPNTAYGYQDSAANPLHTAGGAVWSNITSSGASLIISSSDYPTGSITTAVIDQGSSKFVEGINTSFNATVPNAVAIAVHSASATYNNPPRYTYEMRFGNSSNLSSNEYKIFEMDEKPVLDSNGTGSGDQLFDTGSSTTQVNARYLQMRFTLRTDFTGSA